MDENRKFPIPEGAINDIRFQELVLASQDEPVIIFRGSRSNGQVLATVLWKARIHVEETQYSRIYRGCVADGDMHDSKSFSLWDYHLGSENQDHDLTDGFVFEDFALARGYVHG